MRESIAQDLIREQGCPVRQHQQKEQSDNHPKQLPAVLESENAENSAFTSPTAHFDRNERYAYFGDRTPGEPSGVQRMGLK
jgi:hypothetical protein